MRPLGFAVSCLGRLWAPGLLAAALLLGTAHLGQAQVFVDPYGYAYVLTPQESILRGVAYLRLATAEARVANAEALYIVQQARKAEQEAITMYLENLPKIREQYKANIEFEASLPNFKREVSFKERVKAFTMPEASKDAIRNGAALNTLLEYLKSENDALDNSPAAPIAVGCLASINIACGDNRQGDTLSTFKHGRVQWPMLLRDDPFFKAEKEEIDDAIVQALRAAQTSHGVPLEVHTRIRVALEKLRTKYDEAYMARVVNRERGDPKAWDRLAAYNTSQFLTELVRSLQALQSKPEHLRAYLQPLRAETVAQLVAYMRDNGFSFGPALNNDERDYHRLHAAFVEQVKKVQAAKEGK